eukprot:GHRR01002846.1.p1 GENE.GHRR01002846.1~~GHRR01002846.1.p1  ORF type:complete len:494 (+),score=174.69 GHRR01002846.1:592-2073(+)
MEPADYLPDYSDLYNSEPLSDISIVLHEEPCCSQPISACNKEKEPDADAQSLQHITLPGHSMVMLGFSTYCKTKVRLIRWAYGSLPKSKIQLPVPISQLSIGQLLVKSMYQPKPELAGINQQEALQLIALADRYGVNKVIKAASLMLTAIAAEDWNVSTAIGVYTLPPGCVDSCKELYRVAAGKVHQVLGDLELIWADPGSGSNSSNTGSQKQQWLLQLPYSALKQLLENSKTRVAAESTVFHTIEAWYKEQQKAGAKVTCEQLRQLVALVRMQHCSVLYVGTVISQSTVATACLTPLEIGYACACGAMQAALQPQQSSEPARHGFQPLVEFTGWQASRRPASAMAQLTIDWELPSETIKALVPQHKDDTHMKHCMKLGSWQGQEFELTLQISRSSSIAGGFLIGLYLILEQPGESVIRTVTFHLLAKGVTGNHADISNSAMYTMGKLGAGWPDYFKMGPLSSWEQCEQELNKKKLLHTDGCLHLEAVITSIS